MSLVFRFALKMHCLPYDNMYWDRGNSLSEDKHSIKEKENFDSIKENTTAIVFNIHTLDEVT